MVNVRTVILEIENKDKINRKFILDYRLKVLNFFVFFTVLNSRCRCLTRVKCFIIEGENVPSINMIITEAPFVIIKYY